jgi:hypothetical protein
MNMQPPIRVEAFDRLPPKLAKDVSGVFSSLPMGRIVVPWSELIAETLSDQLEVRFIVAWGDQEPLGLGVVYRIRKLNLLQYVSPQLVKVSRALQRVCLNPLAFDTAFLEVPMRNLSGLFVRPNLQPTMAFAVADAIQQTSRSIFQVPVLCIKDNPESPRHIGVSIPGELVVRMRPNARLDITWPSFEAYIDSRSARRRRHIRYDQNLLKRHEVRIEIRRADEVDPSELVRLFHSTSIQAEQKGSLPIHMRIGASFFAGLSQFIPQEHWVLCAFYQNTLIGFLLAVVSGHEWGLPLCGLDYEHSGPSRAYFNLFYAAIRSAMETGARTICFGTTSYEAKQNLGCVLEAAGYRVAMRSPVFRALGSLIGRNLGKHDPAPLPTQ